MSDSTPTRPRQVTVAAWLIMVGSVVVVLSVFERVSGLRSLETRKAVDRFLAEPPGDGFGMSTESVLDLLHVVSLVAGACAAAMAILGYQLLRRSKAARLMLSVLAVPVFLTGLVAGGFMSSLVAAATAMLWFQPSRDWFDGVTRHRPDPHAPGAQRGSNPAHQPGELPRFGQQGRPGPDAAPDRQPPAGAGPRAVSGFGTPSARPGGHAGDRAADRVGATPGPWGAGQPPPQASPGGADTRPAGLVWACALTWLLSGLTALVLGLLLVLTITSPDLFLDEAAFEEAQDQFMSGLEVQLPTESELIAGTAVMVAVGLLWVGAASVLAILAWRRLSGAHVALFVLTVVSAVGSLALTPFVFVTALPLAGYVVTAVLLWRPDVRAWFARGSRQS
ncbi:hypothetical protein [Nocardioides ferulae]|uniref:hypothetical protein n=1 Tax=Nocardioides ferulae TaxID=2340821 RepID=UPI000F885A75|nr:hypothetical protein [Nocardioides ferulae]